MLQQYEMVEISLVEVFEREGKFVISVCKKALKKVLKDAFNVSCCLISPCKKRLDCNVFSLEKVEKTFCFCNLFTYQKTPAKGPNRSCVALKKRDCAWEE